LKSSLLAWSSFITTEFCLESEPNSYTLAGAEIKSLRSEAGPSSKRIAD